MTLHIKQPQATLTKLTGDLDLSKAASLEVLRGASVSGLYCSCGWIPTAAMVLPQH